MGNADSLRYAVPELWLTGCALSLLVLDVALGRSARRVSLLRLAALAGVLGTGGCLALVPAGEAALFSGLLRTDGLRLAFDWLFFGATLVAVLAAPRSAQLPDRRLGEFYALLFVLVLGLHTMAAATDLLALYLGLETVSLVSYVLAGFGRSRRSNEAALKYAIYGGVASGVLLYGLSLFYGLAGTTRLLGPDGLAVSVAHVSSPAGRAALFCAAIFTLAGIGYKIACVPFHMWVPDVYEGAPTVFTAFLSVAPKAAGFALAIRLFFLGLSGADGGVWHPLASLPWPLVLGVLAAATMLLGNLTALAQGNVKRLLAYSSIAHAGYLLLGLAAASTAGVRAVLVYLLVYLFMNTGAFLAVDAVERSAGGDELAHFRGLAGRAPLVALPFAIFLFSLVGLPPFGGFTGKYLVFAALLQRGGAGPVLLTVFAVANSALSLVVYAKVVRAMVLEEAPADAPALTSSPSSAALLAVLAAGTLATGLLWTPILRWAEAAF